MQQKRRKTPRKQKRPFPRKKRVLKISPGSDPRLKRVFSKIGIPERSEFIPDPFQVQAVEAAKKGDCLVTAPTGAGKTWIAVEAIKHFFEKDQRAWYASP